MREREAGERWREGIRADGTIEGEFIETHFLPVEALYLVRGEGGYLRIVLDGPGINYECRLDLAALEAALAKGRNGA